MVSTMSKSNHMPDSRKHPQQGFALLETLIAIVVLMIGLLAVLATFAMAISNTTSVQNDSIARQKAAEAVESIYTARQTGQLTFNQIQNVGAGNGNIQGGLHAHDGRRGRTVWITPPTTLPPSPSDCREPAE